MANVGVSVNVGARDSLATGVRFGSIKNGHFGKFLTEKIVRINLDIVNVT